MVLKLGLNEDSHLIQFEPDTELDIENEFGWLKSLSLTGFESGTWVELELGFVSGFEFDLILTSGIKLNSKLKMSLD